MFPYWHKGPNVVTSNESKEFWGLWFYALWDAISSFHENQDSNHSGKM